MNIEEAEELDAEIREARSRLRKAFPCEDCDGTGDLNDQNDPYPDICAACWGSGYVLPEEE
jgi:DnaJ-class molecular chaperone